MQEHGQEDQPESALSGITCKLMAKNIPQEIPIKVRFDDCVELVILQLLLPGIVRRLCALTFRSMVTVRLPSGFSSQSR